MIPMGIKIRNTIKTKKAEAMKAALDSTLNYAADKLYLEMRAKAPVKTGRLQNSITKGFIPNGRTVGPNTPYDIYVEFGTQSHWIFPRNATVLHWVDEQGQDRFAKYVYRLSSQARPYVRPAIVSSKRHISNYLQRKVNRALTDGNIY